MNRVIERAGRASCRLVAGLALALLTPALAHAVDFCGLLSLQTLPAISTALEAQGCSLRQDYGVDRRAFNCPDDNVVRVDTSRYGVRTYSASLSGIDGFNADNQFDCPGYRFAVSKTFDNPFVVSAASYSRPAGDLSLALVGFPDDPVFVTACVGYCTSRFEEDLGLVLLAFFGSDRLRFETSDVRIAGLDPAQATRTDLLKALSDRGGLLVQGGDPQALTKQDSLKDVPGVPGLERVDLISIADRLVMVIYNIPAEADYRVFSQSLDDRYGVSSRSVIKGCVERNWASGGVVILGRFCAGKPADSGFTFMNTVAADITSGYLKRREEWEKQGASTRPPSAKPKSDMF